MNPAATAIQVAGSSKIACGNRSSSVVGIVALFIDPINATPNINPLRVKFKKVVEPREMAPDNKFNIIFSLLWISYTVVKSA
ncbi:MAG: hypothetical protein RBT65_04760 [Methanolobus sp.]|nr:hypothetical protein [Methanolobus sp.]